MDKELDPEVDQEVVEAIEELENLEEKEPEKEPDTLQNLKAGYVVGLTKDDKFVFELLGTEKELLRVLGLHQHATKEVDKLYGNARFTGDRLVHEVGKGLNELNRKLSILIDRVAPKKPDNQL